MKLLAAFLAGFVAGVAVSLTYVLSLRSTIKLYRSYIHERIDKQWNEEERDLAHRRRRHTA